MYSALFKYHWVIFFFTAILKIYNKYKKKHENNMIFLKKLRASTYKHCLFNTCLWTKSVLRTLGDNTQLSNTNKK